MADFTPPPPVNEPQGVLVRLPILADQVVLCTPGRRWIVLPKVGESPWWDEP